MFWLLLVLSACSTIHKNEFQSFEQLKKSSIEGVDYKIHTENRNSSLLVLAIHGGMIERGTMELAQAVALDKLSFYIFEGIKADDFDQKNSQSSSMHLTSHKFDDPKLIEIANNTKDCLSLHGHDGVQDFCLGGSNRDYRGKILIKLKIAFPELVSCELCCPPYHGVHEKNVANLCKYQGVQIEMSPKVRKKILSDKLFKNKLSKVLKKIYE